MVCQPFAPCSATLQPVDPTLRKEARHLTTYLGVIVREGSLWRLCFHGERIALGMKSTGDR